MLIWRQNFQLASRVVVVLDVPASDHKAPPEVILRPLIIVVDAEKRIVFRSAMLRQQIVILKSRIALPRLVYKMLLEFACH